MQPVTITTVSHQPVIRVPQTWDAQQIDIEIVLIYGKQESGLPHNCIVHPEDRAWMASGEFTRRNERGVVLDYREMEAR